jgi:hypothetical protein
MGMPVGRLRFAGDSTTPDFPTLVIGAYMTGVQQAGQILSELGLENAQPAATARSSRAPAVRSGSASRAGAPTTAGGQVSVGREEVKKFIIRRKVHSRGGSVDTDPSNYGYDPRGSGVSFKARKSGADQYSSVELHPRPNSASSGSLTSNVRSRSAPKPDDQASASSRPEPSHGGGSDKAHKRKPGPGKK